MKTDDAALPQYTPCGTTAHRSSVYEPLTLDKIGVSARTWTRVSVCVTRRYVSQSLTLGPFRRGCMRNEASAPFLAPFLFSSSPSTPLRATEDGEDPSYDPYPDPRRRPSSTMRTSRRSIQFALRLDSPGKSSCKYTCNCRLYLRKHPPPFPDRAYGNWTSEFDTANFHTRKVMLSLLRHYEFFTPLQPDRRPMIL